MSFHTIEREKAFKNPGSNYQYPELQKITLPHVASFNNIFQTSHPTDRRGLLNKSISYIRPKTLYDSATKENPCSGNKIKIWVANSEVSKPTLSDKEKFSDVRQIYPNECRERKVSYMGTWTVKFCYQVNDGPVISEVRSLGKLPVMIKSNRCNLEGLGPRELVKHHEETEEMGGYFLINGIEKIIRLLIIPRRNLVTSIVRPSFTKRGTNYSEFGSTIRCVREDESACTVTLHYLKDGNCIFKFFWLKAEYLVPCMLILKALIEVSDKEIFEALVKDDKENSFLLDRVEILLRSFKEYKLYSNLDCLNYLGAKFRPVMGYSPDLTDRQVGEQLLEDVVFVHLKSNLEKFNLLIYMILKTYNLAEGKITGDNPDSPQFQEVLLGGHLYANILKERISEWLNQIHNTILVDSRRNITGFDLNNRNYIQRVFQKVNNDLGSKLHYFLATGNLVSRSGLDLMQTTGFVIAAEKLNFLRYLSHFQCIHRGAFFAELKTTTVRKLLPEAWGFLCPVHTPDGAPCGLLNHLAHKCHIVTHYPDISKLRNILFALGVSPVSGRFTGLKDSMIVQLDGSIIGYCDAKIAPQVVHTLRKIKVEGSQQVPLDLEIGFIPFSNGGQYPGIFLLSSPCRMIRPVKYLQNDKIDMVGPFEQVYMEIACLNEDIVPGITTHIEYTPTNILSVVANLTPFSDFNQSPRNMYQCQMGKQTMGTPTQILRYRTDNKLYRLQTGQTPIVRPHLHNEYGMDGFPNGTNAVVCVISYTGYDMEDAMILNKSAHERGFGYGSIYKTEVYDLEERLTRNQKLTDHFGFSSTYRFDLDNKNLRNYLDGDGLPYLGIKLTNGDPLFVTYNEVTGKTRIRKYKGEDAFVDQITLSGSDNGDKECTKLLIKFRIPRPAIIGDKFSSRHGQKGVCSQKWPAVDMPFSESGIQPDVIINPHAFPSRMTIGMFVESMAGKAGALHGCAQDATPFQFSEQDTAVDYFGEQLTKAGYNYYGNEPMYSGITGEEFRVDIYLGVVYYQRLRHMVSDKYQVRATGPVNMITQQPVKGRKKMGGIRFGEMERDSLLAHGVSFLLQDRLMNCSDYSQVYICRTCGSFLSTLTQVPTLKNPLQGIGCRMCLDKASIDLVAIPYVFRYLAAELMGMNIKLKLEVKE